MKKNLIIFSLVALLGITTPAMANPHGGPHGGPHCSHPAGMMKCPPPPPVHRHMHGGFGLTFSTGYYPRRICPAPIFYNYPIGYPCYNYGYYYPDMYIDLRF